MFLFPSIGPVGPFVGLQRVVLVVSRKTPVLKRCEKNEEKEGEGGRKKKGIIEPLPPPSSFVRHPRPVRESSCPTWSFLPVAWFLPDWRFPFLRLRLRSSSPWPPFILSIGRDVSGSAEPALVLYALGTEHLPRCSHMDAILRFVR